VSNESCTLNLVSYHLGALFSSRYPPPLQLVQEPIQNGMFLMQEHQAKRASLRIPASFRVRCQKADNEELGGTASDLSKGGLAFRTNTPIKARERLTVEFLIPDAPHPVSVSGEIVWSQFHEKILKITDSLFSGGIKFHRVEKQLQGLIQDCMLEAFWREFLFGTQEIVGLPSDVQNFPMEERRIVLHNYLFCLLFAEARCPHQSIMDRVYLIPQIINASDLMRCQTMCWSCMVYQQRPIFGTAAV